jgi:hypothetical protein
MKVGDLVNDYKLIKSILFVAGAFFVGHVFGLMFGVIS